MEGVHYEKQCLESFYLDYMSVNKAYKWKANHLHPQNKC